MSSLYYSHLLKETPQFKNSLYVLEINKEKYCSMKVSITLTHSRNLYTKPVLYKDLMKQF